MRSLRDTGRRAGRDFNLQEFALLRLLLFLRRTTVVRIWQQFEHGFRRSAQLGSFVGHDDRPIDQIEWVIVKSTSPSRLLANFRYQPPSPPEEMSEGRSGGCRAVLASRPNTMTSSSPGTANLPFPCEENTGCHPTKTYTYPNLGADSTLSSLRITSAFCLSCAKMLLKPF